MQWIADDRVRGELFLYTFPTIDAYLAAKSGANPFALLEFPAAARRPERRGTTRRSTGFFVQDDWQISPSSSCSSASATTCSTSRRRGRSPPNAYSQDFRIDKNNFGPRAGVSWSLDRQARTVVRASVGMMYEPPLLDFYDNAILSNGDPEELQRRSAAGDRAGRARVSGEPGAPAAGFVLPKQSINAVDPRIHDAVRLAEQRPGRARAQRATWP